MKVIARWDLAPRACRANEPALLLEGSWPNPGSDRHASLDESIDARFAWMDHAAMDLADRAAFSERGSLTFANIHALALRYYLVKLLRPIAYFRDVVKLACGATLDLVVARGRDEDYVDLFRALSRARQWPLRVHWQDRPRERHPLPRPVATWRRVLARLCAKPAETRATPADGRARVVFCGNPRHLDPICQELVTRGTWACWLYEEFAWRSWWRWRRWGVPQFVCQDGKNASGQFSDAAPWLGLEFDGVDLSAVVQRWLGQRLPLQAERQARWLSQLDAHFSRVRPTHVVLDEDATPFKRAVLAAAGRHGARSFVMQHGIPCVPFGFAPLAADQLLAWDDASRRQFVQWGIPEERMHVVGSPSQEKVLSHLPRAQDRQAAARRPRILVLATVPPRDGRPDAVTYHQTSQTHQQLLEMAFAAVSRLSRARLTVKLHPRAQDAGAIEQTRRNYPRLQSRLVRRASLESLLRRCDCVLSFASGAGMEAARAGFPVIQLLPPGSADLLPAHDWGLVGTARSREELESLLQRTLQEPWFAESLTVDRSSDGDLAPAAKRAADAILAARPGETTHAASPRATARSPGRPALVGSGSRVGAGGDTPWQPA